MRCTFYFKLLLILLDVGLSTMLLHGQKIGQETSSLSLVFTQVMSTLPMNLKSTLVPCPHALPVNIICFTFYCSNC